MVAVIGDPVDHSRSPAIHNAAFAALGLDWVMVALPVAAGEAAGAVVGLRSLGLRGASVTMPHKAAVLDHLDDLEPAAAALGAVNCIRRRSDGTLVGGNTDGPGFVRGLADDLDVHPAGARCVVLGAGGAARAVVLALASGGAASVDVVARRAERAAVAAALAGSVGAAHEAGSPTAAAALGAADVVVNATPVGMAGGPDPGGVPVDVGLLGAHAVVAELVYHPVRTPLLAAAAERGLRGANGHSMLVHQAAVAFESWTGVAAPLAVMRAAVLGG